MKVSDVSCVETGLPLLERSTQGPIGEFSSTCPFDPLRTLRTPACSRS